MLRACIPRRDGASVGLGWALERAGGPDELVQAAGGEPLLWLPRRARKGKAVRKVTDQSFGRTTGRRTLPLDGTKICPSHIFPAAHRVERPTFVAAAGARATRNASSPYTAAPLTMPSQRMLLLALMAAALVEGCAAYYKGACSHVTAAAPPA